jgi:hypothetical protein
LGHINLGISKINLGSLYIDLGLYNINLCLTSLGDWWRRTEREVKASFGDDVHVMALYLYSDETVVSQVGNTAVYPIHMSVGNFTSECRSVKENARILVAYFPVCETLRAVKSASYVKQRLTDVRQQALQILLEPLIEVSVLSLCISLILCHGAPFLL